MQLELEGKVAVVTGASGGIGLAAARALAAGDALVVAGARSSSDELGALVETAPSEFVAVDLSTPSGPVDFAAAALAHGGISASARAGNVTGADVTIDGGLIKTL
jgi:NAD(P)-dependent dehydrogenase (short-subunit alcohol dehydrogenase family)